MSLTILTTGAAGFIGSHTVLELLNAGHTVIGIDNGSNCYHDKKNELPESLKRVEKITGKKITFYSVDIRDKAGLDAIFKKHKIDCVIHFAAFKAVGESCKKPIQYYQNNIGGTSILLEVMTANGIFNIVFSSSATVYGEFPPSSLPLTENLPTGNCTNPYGKSKYFTEEMFKDLCASDKRWNVIALRYFNPGGAHKSGIIGEDPTGEPHNLMPYISQVAIGRRKALPVFGSDWPTHDGTGIRDYTHIVDLAQGHLAALSKLSKGGIKGFVAYNLGTGVGYSVLDMVKCFAAASGKEIPYELKPRRDGDVATCYCHPGKAEAELGWKAKYGLKDMCEDLWRFQKTNPNGYVA